MALLASIACEACRRCHRKCDRLIPACTYCADKNKTCKYPDPLARTRTTKPNKTVVFRDVTQKYMSSNIIQKSVVDVVNPEENRIERKRNVSPPSVLESELVRRASVFAHVDICLDKMYFFMPVIELEKARSIMYFIRNSMNMGRMDVGTPKTSELALIFAIQATHFVRSGKTTIANALYEKSRELLLPIFDVVDENFEVAATYACLTQYLLSSGNLDKAAFFIRNAKKYLNNMARKRNSSKERTLEWSVLSSTQLLECNQSLSVRLSHMNVYFDNDQDKLLILNDLDCIDNMLVRIINYMDRNVNGRVPLPDAISKKLYFFAIAQGAKLQIMKERDADKDQLLQIANSIADVTMSEYFPVCHCMIAISVMEAAFVHAKLLSESPSRELIERLRQDYNGIVTISQRNLVIRMRYGDYISKLESLIAFHDDVFQKVSPLSIFPSFGGIQIQDKK